MSTKREYNGPIVEIIEMLSQEEVDVICASSPISEGGGDGGGIFDGYDFGGKWW